MSKQSRLSWRVWPLYQQGGLRSRGQRAGRVWAQRQGAGWMVLEHVTVPFEGLLFSQGSREQGHQLSVEGEELLGV